MEYSREESEIVSDYAEFSGIPFEKLLQHIKDFHQLINAEWFNLDAESWDDKAKMFYNKSENYILDLLKSNPDLNTIEKKLEKYGVWQFLDQLPLGFEILEFGGGLGGTCQLFYERGYRVTYLDIPGKQMNFSRWRFKKYNLPIHIIKSHPDKLRLDNKYHFVFSDAAFEHLVDPCQVADELMQHIYQGGFMLLLIDTFNINKMWPMHHALDFNALDKTLSNCGGTPKQISPDRMINLWHKE